MEKEHKFIGIALATVCFCAIYFWDPVGGPIYYPIVGKWSFRPLADAGVEMRWFARLGYALCGYCLSGSLSYLILRRFPLKSVGLPLQVITLVTIAGLIFAIVLHEADKFHGAPAQEAGYAVERIPTK